MLFVSLSALALLTGYIVVQLRRYKKIDRNWESLNRIVDRGEQGVAVVSKQGKILYQNHVARDVYRLSGILEKPECIEPSFQLRNGFVGRLNLETTEGDEANVEVRVSATLWDKQLVMLIHFIDVTRWTLAELHMAHQEQLYRTLCETIPHHIWLADEQGAVWYRNKAFREATGRCLSTSIGSSWTDYLTDEDKALMKERWVRAASEKESFQGTCRLVLKDGSRRLFTTIGTPVVESNGQVSNWVGVNLDITEIEEARQNLSKTIAELERSNEELQSFASFASHDLQEPLRKITSFSQLLQDDLEGESSERVKQDLDFIVDAASRMRRMIQDLLELSKVGKKIERKEVCLDECIDRALANIDFGGSEVSIERDPMPVLSCDPGRVTQLYQNLLANAFKFRRPEVPLLIRLSVHLDEESKTYTFGVHDNGIGMEKESASQAFLPFRRLHGKIEGTGIGLAICSRVVERHGGTIWVESEGEGCGASFLFTLEQESKCDQEAA